MTDVCVILCTFPDADIAAEVGRALVEAELAACVNLVPGVRSIYLWGGAVQDDGEVLAVAKTAADRVADLTSRLVALHPYDVPEVLVLPVEAGHADYLRWVVGATRR